MARSRSRSGGMTRQQQEAFISRFADVAIAAAELAGVSPEVVLGQAAIESGWGAAIKGGNALGIKGKGQSFATKENIPGVGMVNTVESFRTYAKPEDSFLDYGRFVGDMGRYAAARNATTVADQVAAIGKSGYATDPNYGNLLGQVVDRIQESKVFQDKVVNAVAATPPASVDLFSGVGIPTGQVSFAGNLPDLSPASAGFSLAGATLPDNLSLDLADVPMSLEDFTPVDAAPVDLSGVYTPGPVMTEQQAFDRLVDPRLSSNVEVRLSEFGVPIDEQAQSNWATEETVDYLSANAANQLGFDLNTQALTTDPFENLPARETDFGTWGMDGATKFDDQFNGRAITSTNPNDYNVTSYGIDPVGAFGMGETFGVSVPRDYSDITAGIFDDAPAQPSGFSAGFDAGPWGQTPDFSAPSLEQRNAEAFGIDRLENHALSLGNPSDMWDENIAASVMAEIGQPMAQSTPQLAAAPMSQSTFDSVYNAGMQDYMGTSLPSLAAGSFSPPSFSSPTSMAATPLSGIPQGDFGSIPPAATHELPTTTSALQSLPSTSLSAPPSIASGFSLPETAPLPPSRPTETGFFDGWSTPGLIAGGVGLVTGGIPGAVLGYQAGKYGAQAFDGLGSLFGGTSSPFGGFSNPFSGGMFDRAFQGFDGYDYSTHGYGPGFNSRGERSHTGRDESGNATVGDGSYAERSGYNDNNPQGIY